MKISEISLNPIEYVSGLTNFFLRHNMKENIVYFGLFLYFFLFLLLQK